MYFEVELTEICGGLDGAMRERETSRVTLRLEQMEDSGAMRNGERWL